MIEEKIISSTNSSNPKVKNNFDNIVQRKLESRKIYTRSTLKSLKQDSEEIYTSIEKIDTNDPVSEYEEEVEQYLRVFRKKKLAEQKISLIQRCICPNYYN